MKIISSVSGDWHDEGFVQFFTISLDLNTSRFTLDRSDFPFFFLFSWTFSHVGLGLDGFFWSERNKNEGWDLGH